MKQISQTEYRSLFEDEGPELPDLKLVLAGPEDFPLPRRPKRAHKYRFGRALLIAGSAAYSGAPVLAANACERGGAGLTQLCVPESIFSAAAARCDGAVVTALPAAADGGFSEAAIPPILEALRRADACAVGPGLGTSAPVKALLSAILREAACPLVLDADALNLIALEPSLLAVCRAPLLLTPHEGEFKRLGGDLSAGRLAGALAFSKAHGDAVLILKGFGTLVCRGGEISVNPSGGPALAKGGSGDVLCGLLCALLAQGFEPLFAARCAVCLHGLAGDLACAAYGEYCVTPSDLIRFLPGAFRRVCDTPKEG